jgi:hypothetical protein
MELASKANRAEPELISLCRKNFCELALWIALAHGHGFILEAGFAIGVGKQDHFGEFSHWGLSWLLRSFKVL